MKLLSTVFFVVMICSLQLSAQNKRELQKQWNMKEKDQLIQSIQDKEYYKGIFIQSLQTATHELIPQSDGSYNYKVVGEYISYSCNYQGSDADALVAMMMESQQDMGGEGCEKIDQKNNHPNKAYQILGALDKRWVGLKYYPEEGHYLLHYIGENGLEEQVDDRPFSEALRPLIINSKTRLMLDKSNNSVYLVKGKKQTELGEKLAKNLSKVTEIPHGLISDYIQMGDDYLYLPEMDSDNDEVGLIKASLKDGKMEIVLTKATLPRLDDEHLYYYLPTRPQNLEEAQENSGLYKKSLKSGEITQLFNILMAKEIGFQARYLPNYEGKFVYQLIGSYGVSIVNMIGLEELVRLNKLFNQALEAERKYKEYRKSNPEAGSAVTAEAVDSAEEAVSVEAETEVTEEEGVTVAASPKIDKKLEKLRKERKATEDTFEQEFIEAVESYYVPEDYLMVKDPVSDRPIFISNNPDWPVFQLGQLLPIQNK